MSVVRGQTKLIHTPEFRWLDKAATPAKAPGAHDRWLVTITEVEELKCVVRLLPFMCILAVFFAIYAQMSTLFVLQGSAMNRYLGSWAVPAAIISVLDTASVLIWVPIYDMVIDPYFKRIGRPISRLTRMGIGFGIAIMSMVFAALVEVFRLRVVRDNNLQVRVCGRGGRGRQTAGMGPGNGLRRAAPCDDPREGLTGVVGAGLAKMPSTTRLHLSASVREAGAARPRRKPTTCQP